MQAGFLGSGLGTGMKIFFLKCLVIRKNLLPLYRKPKTNKTMNKHNDWKTLLKYANEDLANHGYELNVYEEDGYYFCDIWKDVITNGCAEKIVIENYAGNYFEDELSDLITDAWHYVLTELISTSKNNKKANTTKTYYQPEWYFDDGTDIEYGGTPDELHSFQAFESREDCENWLIEHGYGPDDFVIHEYHDDDIEDVVIIDEYDNVLE